MSSRVNLGLLVDHINSLPETYSDWQQMEFLFLDPNLKFKILYYCGRATTTLPPLNQHFPESFFSFDVSTKELKQIHSQSQSLLRKKVHAAFIDKISMYAALLQCKSTELPKDVLYVLLPFVCGKPTLSERQLADIVAAVGKMLSSKTMRMLEEEKKTKN